MSRITATARRENLRAVLGGPRCVLTASVFDPLSARAAEDLGYGIGMLAGSVAALAVLGAPDWTLLTLSELAGLARRITRAGSLSLLVDADHGYGNALNVMRTVEELENADVAGLSIEDTDLPARFGQGRAGQISTQELCAKLRAAVAARRDPALVILGRTLGPGAVGLDACRERIRAIQQTGVDGVFLVGSGGPELLGPLRSELELPVVVGGLAGPPDPRALAEVGARIALQPHLPIQAAIAAAVEALAALQDGAVPAGLRDRLPDPETLARLMRRSDYDRYAKEFLDS